MALHRSLAVVSGLSFVLLAASTLTGCDLLKKKAEGDTSTTGGGGDAPGEKSAPKGKPIAGCAIPAEVTAEVTVKKGCSVVLDHNVQVKGGTLRVEPGATIKVAQGHYIWVYEGKLVAKGTEKEPIVFTSANKTQAPGDWVGIGLDDKTQAGTELDFVKVEFGGESSQGGRGCLTVRDQRSAKRITVTNSTFTSCDQSAIHDESDKGGFAKLEKNTFKKNKTSLDVHAQVLGSVGAGNVFSDPIHVDGNVTETATWPVADVPVILGHAMEIGGAKTAATLTIPAKTVVKVGAGNYISVGTASGGGLIANGVTFTSSNAAPHAGDWVGLFIYAQATNVSLDGAVIEYAGADAAGGRAAITFHDIDAKKKAGPVKIANVTFRNNLVAAIASPDHDCGPFAAGGNKSAGVPMCRAD